MTVSFAGHLLTGSNAKTIKGEKRGYLTGILYLAPANLSGVELCPSRSKGCTRSCLFTAGRAGIFQSINEARMRKTKLFLEDRQAFMIQLVSDIYALREKAKKHGLEPVVRLNGTSDIDWENIPVLGHKNIFEIFPSVQFYDYTKRLDREEQSNYRLVFSKAENNKLKVKKAIQRGWNVAIVFDKVPTQYAGQAVVNGDEDDLRFLDAPGSIIGLKAKGQGRQDTSGFVVRA